MSRLYALLPSVFLLILCKLDNKTLSISSNTVILGYFTYAADIGSKECMSCFCASKVALCSACTNMFRQYVFAELHVWYDETSHCVATPRCPPSPPTQAEISSLQQLLLTKNAEIESLHTQLSARPSLSPQSSERGKATQPGPPTRPPTVAQTDWLRRKRLPFRIHERAETAVGKSVLARHHLIAGLRQRRRTRRDRAQSINLSTINTLKICLGAVSAFDLYFYFWRLEFYFLAPSPLQPEGHKDQLQLHTLSLFPSASLSHLWLSECTMSCLSLILSVIKKKASLGYLFCGITVACQERLPVWIQTQGEWVRSFKYEKADMAEALIRQKKEKKRPGWI